MNFTFTRDQEEALVIMESGANCFITGEAGTGKSFVVEYYISQQRLSGKEVLVTAPTGTAADNISGITIHRAFGAPIGVIPEREVKQRDPVLQLVDIIVIDEISMCRFDLFDYVARMIEYENDMRLKDRFQKDLGILDSAKDDIQLIVMGDFYQLPPVMSEDDEIALLKMYPETKIGKGYAFNSPHWKMLDFNPIKLTENVRQEDKVFKNILNQIRTGKNKRACISWMMNESSDFPFDDDESIFLSATNKDVNNINMNQLARLPGKEYVFPATCTGDVKQTEKFADDELHLKEGCKVMFTVNDQENRFVNGTIGIVETIKNGECAVFIPGKSISVWIGPLRKEIVRPKVVEKEKTITEINDQGEIVRTTKTISVLEQEVIGSFEQFPLRLAYAITIHKSQGKTFERMNMNPYCWDEGQFYTGISRCKKIENICFLQRIQARYIVASEEVIKHESQSAV